MWFDINFRLISIAKLFGLTQKWSVEIRLRNDLALVRKTQFLKKWKFEIPQKSIFQAKIQKKQKLYPWKNGSRRALQTQNAQKSKPCWRKNTEKKTP